MEQEQSDANYRSKPSDRVNGHFLNDVPANYGSYLRERRAILYPALSSEYFEHFVAVDGADLWLRHHFLQPGEKPQDFPMDFTAEGFEELYGIAADGAVLVRPDGYVGARWKQLDDTFPEKFRAALDSILKASAGW
jgi:hypothetical protein